jgi:hypothetical protein
MFLLAYLNFAVYGEQVLDKPTDSRDISYFHHLYQKLAQGEVLS